MSSGPSARRRGTVRSFDDSTGLGVLESGDDSWSFHCTAIADGSRTIDAVTAVDFVLWAGHHGCWEAADIQLVD